MPRDRFVVVAQSFTGVRGRQDYWVLDRLHGSREVQIGRRWRGRWTPPSQKVWSSRRHDLAQGWVDELHRRHGRIEDFHGYEAYPE